MPRRDASASPRHAWSPRPPIGGRVRALVGVVAGLGCAWFAATPSRAGEADPMPAWSRDVGARRTPGSPDIFTVQAFGPMADGSTMATSAIQSAIDRCAAAGGGVVAFKPGTYLTGALFLKGNVEFRVDTGVTLRGTKDLAAYPRQWTRVAGIEMMWPAALLNICDARNVKVSGGGTIDGDGAASWSHYAAMVRQYEARGLRWVVDYDCERIRLLQVWRSSDVTVQDVHLRRSGFWTVQVCYSEHVTVSGISIHDNAGPSTDGVDVDSSRYVLVQDCDIDNNDDCICLKAGRDADGLRVNRPTEYVLIRDNLTRRGSGMVTFGSETSGGIRHVLVERNRALGTAEGIRFKSARTRGGYVRDVVIRDVTMTDVPSPFTITLDWFPSYSYAATNADWSGSNVPAHWKVLTTPVTPPERGWCRIEDVSIENVRITGANQIFTASGLPGDPVRDIRWRNVTAEGKRAGRIEYASGWSMRDVTLSTPAPDQLVLANCTDMTVPSVRTKP